MKEIVADPGMVAYCGLYCGACKAFLKDSCPGCHVNEKATWCKVRTCCKGSGFASCAECREHEDPNDCRKFNNVISRVVGFVLRSDRKACISQIKAKGLQGHAANMAETGRQTIRLA